MISLLSKFINCLVCVPIILRSARNIMDSSWYQYSLHSVA